MSREILHVADIHLDRGEDRNYSLSVLDDVVGMANEHEVAALLIAGDLFNSYADIEELRGDVRAALARVEAPVVYVPGNHEELRASGGDASRFDLGDIHVMHRLPFELLSVGDGDGVFEVLAIPFQRNGYSGYREWSVPPKAAPVRVALAHAVVADMGYWVEDLLQDEERGAIMDPDLFVYHAVDYAALGHIHCPPAAKEIEGTTINYAGSARVWRKGESAPRGAWLVDLDSGRRRRLELASAGQYRALSVPLDLEGLPPDLSSVVSSWGPNDFVEFQLFGVVDDERAVAETEELLRKQLGPQVRAVAFDRNVAHGGVEVLAGIASEPMAQKFLTAWQTRMDELGGEREDWLRARQLGLLALKKTLGAGK